MNRSKNEVEESKFFNRELSWLQFNSRVLQLAEDENIPLLERVNYLSIFESNLDEFYMVRVSGLLEQEENGVNKKSIDGLTPTEQLSEISKVVQKLRTKAGRLLLDNIIPDLNKNNINLVPFEELTILEKKHLDHYFHEKIFPLCTPVLLYPSVSIPFISNRCLSIIAMLGTEEKYQLARIKVPTSVPRFIPTSVSNRCVLIENLICNHLKSFFIDIPILNHSYFRVIRDADIELRETEACDLIEAMEQTLYMRRFGDPVMLEVSSNMPQAIVDKLCQLLKLDKEDVIIAPEILGLKSFSELAALDRPDLKFQKFNSEEPTCSLNTEQFFNIIKNKDILVHHPYQSFEIVENFVHSAKDDPKVLGIKQTLYRVGKNSPILNSLLDAAKLNKQVAVLMEIKARFDESNNIDSARALERAGAHVTYGFENLKTHCKLCLIVRKEKDIIQSYVHIGTGNYNSSTAKIYTDMGIFTSDKDIVQDVLELFNYLTGFSQHPNFRKLLVSPSTLRSKISEKIRHEIYNASKGRKAYIAIKVNSLVDKDIIKLLYKASKNGVKVDLIVRGICCLKPGVKDLSENIRVVSIIGRFLEHSRMYYFHNNNNPDVYIGSADIMSRNLDRRIEVLTPIQNKDIIARIKVECIDKYMNDNTNAWELKSDGTYVRKKPSENIETFAIQEYYINYPDTLQKSA